jgi:hypothetical protein
MSVNRMTLAIEQFPETPFVATWLRDMCPVTVMWQHMTCFEISLSAEYRIVLSVLQYLLHLEVYSVVE